MGHIVRIGPGSIIAMILFIPLMIFLIFFIPALIIIILATAAVVGFFSILRSKVGNFGSKKDSKRGKSEQTGKVIDIEYKVK